MTKLFATTLACLLSTVTFSQSIETVRISFAQTLYPKNPLPNSIKNYNCVITTPYLKDDSSFRKIAEEKYQQDLKNYPSVVRDAQKHYDEVILVQHQKNVADAKEKYKLENDEFNKMSTLERLALIDKKPVLRIPEKPSFVSPREPMMQSINVGETIILHPETLAKSYIKLEGFGDGLDGAQIDINFKGFDFIDPVATVVDVENYNPQTKEKFTTKQTQFVTKYKHPTSLEIKANNSIVKSGIFDQTATYKVMTTSSKPSRYSIERQEVELILKEINKYLNDQYGFTKSNRLAIIYYVKNKKGEYDDIEKAKDFAQSGYKNYTINQEEATKDILNAISIWEKTITEVNYDDNKARIDEKVGIALLKNLIFSCIITNEFEKADKYILAFKNLRLNYDDKQFIETHEKLYIDLKSRFISK